MLNSMMKIAEWLIVAGVALFWMITYILIIIRSKKDQFCGMPLPAICANITWEFLFTFVMPFHPLQQAVTFIWLLLDCVILFQYFIYSKKADKATPLHTTYQIVLSLLIMFLLLHYGSALEFQDEMGVYSAFSINLMMSVLFVNLVREKGLLGQSLAIAYFKMIGTLCASILCYAIYPQSILLNILYVLTFAADAVYIVIITQRSLPKSSSSDLSTKAL